MEPSFSLATNKIKYKNYWINTSKKKFKYDKNIQKLNEIKKYI